MIRRANSGLCIAFAVTSRSIFVYHNSSRASALSFSADVFSSPTVVSSAASLDLTLHQLLHKSPPPPTLSPLAAPSPLPSSSHAPLHTALSSLEASLQSGSGTPFEKNSARIVRAHALFALGEWEKCLEGLKGVELECPVDGAWEGYDLVLRVVGSAVEGELLQLL